MPGYIYGWMIDRFVPERFRSPLRGFLDRFMEGLHSLRNPLDVAMIFFTSLVIWLAETVKYWFVMHCFDFEVPFYVLMLMIQTLRLAVGPWWQPTELRLQNNDAAGLADVELLRQANVQFDRPVLGIAFPSSFLSMPLRGNGVAASPAAQPGGTAIQPASDFLGSLRQVLHSFIRGGQVSIDTVAEIAGISVRTLQRRFAEMGVSYSDLLDEVRFQAAVPLLEDASIRMTDIAFDLGYSDPAHFTRAFRRLAGVSPREFRRQRLETLN